MSCPFNRIFRSAVVLSPANAERNKKCVTNSCAVGCDAHVQETRSITDKNGEHASFALAWIRQLFEEQERELHQLAVEFLAAAHEMDVVAEALQDMNLEGIEPIALAWILQLFEEQERELNQLGAEYIAAAPTQVQGDN